MKKDKLPPSDIKLEEIVLGALMQFDVFSEVSETLSPGAFYNSFNADVYRAVVSLCERGERPDMVLVAKEMQRMNMNVDVLKITSMAENVVWDINPHVNRLSELEKRRKLILLSHKINAMAFDLTKEAADIVFDAENGLKDVVSDNRATFSTMKDAVKGVFQQIDKNNSGSATLTGHATGFSRFDQRGGGLQKSDLVIIAGETSQGKSALAITIAMNASTISNASMAFYSMEMKKEQVAARMMSVKSGVPPNQMMYSKLTSEQFEMIDRGIAGLCDRKIYFDDRSTSNIDTIISSIRTLKKKYGVDGAIIDYLQILNVNMKGTNKEQQMGEVARRLKNLAKELDIWIIALSQLSRDNSNPVPTLNRLRDSGQIAEAADVVMLIYRPEYYGRSYDGDFKNITTSGTALIDVSKGRNIGQLKFICGFDHQTTAFYEMDDLDGIKMRKIEYDDIGQPIPF